MTREEKLYSMTMVNLVEVANKLGVKIDKKGAKSKAVAKILEAENAQNEVKNLDEIQDDEYVAEVMEQKKELGIECPPIESVEIVSDECAGDGTPLAEVGKEIAEQAKEKAKKAKKKVEKAERVDVIAITEETVKKLNLTYKRYRDGIVVFVSEKRVLELWKCNNKVRFCMSADDSKFVVISESSLISNLYDIPSKNAKLNKSFYVELSDLSSVLSLYFA